MNQSSELQDAFIASLTKRLSQEPSVALNPHCLSERTLYALFDDLFVAVNKPQLSKKDTKIWLEEIGLLARIAVEDSPKGAGRNTRFYRLDLSAKHPSQANPLELLQASEPAGIICYFTSLAFHSLTTQPPSHHHIAVLSESREKQLAVVPRTKPVVRSLADPLGEWLFTYKDIRYYKTTKEKRLVPGIQTRFLNPTTLVRITTLEQTLLDTLHKPLSCGGPAVVMEAWEQGITRAKEEKLASNLQKMNHLPIAQRLGFIFSILEHKVGPVLKNALNNFLERLDPNDPEMYQQLFPGMKYGHLHRPWLIYGPE